MDVSRVVGRIAAACSLGAALASVSQAQSPTSGEPTPTRDTSIVAPTASAPMIPLWPLPSDRALDATLALSAPAARPPSGPSATRIIIGAVVGATIGTIVGVRHGERVDRACGGDNQCSGPPLTGLVDGVIFAVVGGGVGGLVGYFWRSQ